MAQETMTPADEPRIVKIFVSHQWFSMEYPVGTDNDYMQVYLWLLEAEIEEGWFIQDMSVPPEKGLYDTNSAEEIKEFLECQMSSSDIVINAGAGVYNHSREWICKEARMARATKVGTPPVLSVRPRSAYWWSGYFTDRADAWAIWTRKSVVDGVRSLLDLTPDRRSELLKQANPCKTCGKRKARLELNRLRGAYCTECGTVAYRLNRRPLRCWRDWGRRHPGGLDYITKRRADAARRKDDAVALAEAATSVGWFVPESDWGVRFCAELTDHPHPYVRGSAVRSLYYRAQVIGKPLDRRIVKPAVRAATHDKHPYVRSQGYITADYLKRELKWRLDI